MANTNKQNLKTRIIILYIVYFAALLGGVIYNTAPAMKRGAKLGSEVNQILFESLGDDRLRVSQVFINVPLTVNRQIDLLQADDTRNTSISLAASRFDMLVSQDAENDTSFIDIIFRSVGGSAAVYISSIMLMLLNIAVFVLIFLIINSLRRSAGNDTPLSPKCVWYTRTIGLILIVIDFLNAWSEWTMAKGAAKFLEGSEYTVNTDFNLNYYTLLLAALVIFTAEIFSIGSKLGEEQKLTI
ncbi:MAG: DUF2975 domain-containing protein [Alistipes sp.]|nr:DUF2975 domain-containing protein [Alistipes sp.]